MAGEEAEELEQRRVEACQPESIPTKYEPEFHAVAV
jgi:hypothetical protein